MALSRQVPFLYGTLLINTLFLAATHAPVAPTWLTVWVPVAMGLVCVGRLVAWVMRRGRVPDHARAARHLATMRRLALLLTVGFTSWGAALHQYGDATTRMHIIFYLSLTCSGTILCLMQTPSGVFRVAVIAVPIIAGLLLWSGDMVHTFVAANFALAIAALILVMWRHAGDFRRLVDSQTSLVAKQAELQALSDENLRLANLDSLTGLANRRMFFATLAAVLDQARQCNESVALGILDLDGFKGINDAYGHGVGDQLLVAVADRLNRACGADFLPHRLGGDEFALIATRPMDDDALLAAGRRLSDALVAPCRIGDVTVQTTGTTGFAVFPQASTELQELFDRADYALYHAKKCGGRGQPILFSSEHMTAIRSEGIVVEVMKTADLDAELHLVYQPIVDSLTDEVLAFEALARWSSPILGAVPPSSFIPVAERIGMVGTLTRLLLPKALAALATWPQPVRLSFNLSTHDIGSPDTMAALAAAVRRSGIDPQRICFEITETALVQDLEQALDSIQMLIELGAGVALDDFGTGYSSLAQLHRIPLHKLKIDRAFVTGIDMSPTSRRIVQTIVTLSREMGLASVVEGVETEAERRVIRMLGADMMQGYFFARPMAASDVAAFLASRATPAACAG